MDDVDGEMLDSGVTGAILWIRYRLGDEIGIYIPDEDWRKLLTEYGVDLSLLDDIGEADPDQVLRKAIHSVVKKAAKRFGIT